MNRLEKMRRYTDDLYDVSFMYNGKEIGVKRCVDFDNLEHAINNFCGYVYNVREIYQSVYYVSSLVVQVEPVRFNGESKNNKPAILNTKVGEYRRVLIDMKRIEALHLQSEYDIGLYRGLDRALDLLDDTFKDIFKEMKKNDI